MMAESLTFRFGEFADLDSLPGILSASGHRLQSIMPDI
jgi:hypothetical protein